MTYSAHQPTSGAHPGGGHGTNNPGGNGHSGSGGGSGDGGHGGHGGAPTPSPGGDGGSAGHDMMSGGGIDLISTNPTVDLELSDLLKSESGCGDCGDGGSFVGVGDVSLGVTAPTVIGIGASGDDAGGGSGGGLLTGLC